jgi:hypothetical protein
MQDLVNEKTESGGNFLRMLRQLRLYEEVVLYNGVPAIPAQELEEARQFLQSEYERELREYPKGAPAFHADAALWAAVLIYRASQLLLYREQKSVQLNELFPRFAETRDPAVILSADLTLRFLPSVLEKATEIDPEDALIGILKNVAADWDYSAVGSNIESPLNDFQLAGKIPLLQKLYVDRVIAVRDKKLAAHPLINQHIRRALGLYTNELWTNFDLIKTNTE